MPTTPFTLATWNVNSLRTRLEHVLNFIETAQPTVLCLQETKVMDDLFPEEPFASRGYTIAKHGQKSYNGVAILSKAPLENIQTGFQHANPAPEILEQARFISATIHGVRVLNAYVPQGENVDSSKFQFKKAFYTGLAEELALYSPTDELLLCADFNIARGELDVDKVEKRSGKCMFTPEEHGWLERLEAWGLVDAFRYLNPDDKQFSWWDYRQLAFQLNRGLRIDWHYVTPDLLPHVKEVTHFRDLRKADKPSDHIPVLVSLA